MNMICGHCGSEVKEGFKVCANCGANLRRNLNLWTLGLSLFLLFVGAAAIQNNVLSGLLIFALAAFVAYRAWQKKWYRRNV